MDKDKNNNNDMNNNNNDILNDSKNSDDNNQTNQSTIQSTKENIGNAKRMREENEEDKEVATSPAKISKKNPPPVAPKEDPPLLLSKKAPPPVASKKNPPPIASKEETPTVASAPADDASTDEGSGHSLLRAVDSMRCNIQEYRMRHSQGDSNSHEPSISMSVTSRNTRMMQAVHNDTQLV